MDRTLVGLLLRPRHLAATLAVFLALGGLGGFIVGAATADDVVALEGEPLDTFALAAPLAGDRGLYEIRAAPGSTLAQAYDRTWTRSIAFEVLEDAVLRNTTGVAQWANRIRVNETSDFGREGLEHRDTVFGLVPGSTDGFAYLHPSSETRRNDDDDSTTYATHSSVNFVKASPDLPCGFRNPMQGQLTPVPSNFGDVQSCRQGPGVRDGEERKLRADQAVLVNGTRLLRASIVDDGGLWGPSIALRYLYREDIPYPLQVQEPDEPYVHVLVAFERGLEPIRSEAEVVDGAPAPLEFAPVQAWGPDDSGVEHPFPAHEAFNQARDDPQYAALRDFLASHEDTYVARMHYGNLYSDGSDGDWQHWSFLVTDGQDALDVSVRRIDRTTLPREVPALDVLPSAPASTYDYSDRGVEDVVGDYPLPKALDAVRFPTVASMLRQWAAYASPDFAQRIGNSWSISVRCTYDGDAEADDCSRADVVAQAGHVWYTRDYPDDALPFQGAQPLDGYVESTLMWYVYQDRDDLTFDHPYIYAETKVDWRDAGQPAPSGESAGTGPASQEILPLAVEGIWHFPSTRDAAVIGAGAFVGGLLYFLWPLAKGGGIGLFSRVHKDRLLDNPLRAQLVQRIESEPGIHHNALVRDLAKGKGAAEHHLDKLVAARLVLRHRSPGYTCYFPIGTDHRLMAASPATKADGARRILEALNNGVIGVRGIAIVTDLAPSTVSHHLERLRAAGLVVGDGRTGYHPARVGAAGQAAA